MTHHRERSTWLAVTFVGLIFLCSVVIGYRGALRSIAALDPISVEVKAREGAALPLLALEAESRFPPRIVLDPSPNGRWLIVKRAVSEITLILPENWRDWLDTVSIAIGERSHVFDATRVENTWQRVATGGEAAKSGEFWRAPTSVIANRGIVAAQLGALNWPGDGDIAARTLAFPVLLTLALLFVMFRWERWQSTESRRQSFKAIFEPAAPGDAERAAADPVMVRAWAAFGLGVLASALMLLERIDPYYFVQDDNLSQFLPVVLHGCQLLGQDQWPDYNIHQLMGAPMASVGIYALSYPPLWLSCLIADEFLHLKTAVFEVYAAMHLILGFIATFALGRRHGLSPPLASGLGLSFALCGFFLIGGRSWYYMLPVATWLPVLLLSATYLQTTTRPFRWIAVSGIAIGLFFHAGNAQMWSYAVLAWGTVIGLDWLAGRLPWRRLVWAGAAGIFGLGIAAPLLVPQFMFVARMTREAAEGNGIWNGIGALFLPYPLIKAGHPNGWGNPLSGTMSQFYYSGTVFTLAGAVVVVLLLGSVLRGRMPVRVMARPWTLMAIFTFVLAIGTPALLWPLVDSLPFFRHFTHPFKLLPFLILFLNMTGAIALQIWLPRRGAWHLGVALVVAMAMIWHVGLSRQSFFTFEDDPYRSLPSSIDNILRAEPEVLSARVMSGAPVQWHEGGFTASASANLATFHRLVSIDGYGSMVWYTPENTLVHRKFLKEPEAARRRYGARWLLLYRASRLPESPIRETREIWDGSPLAEAYQPRFRGGPAIATASDLQLYDLGGADPLAFFADDAAQPLRARPNGAEVIIELPPLDAARAVVVNFLHRPGTVLRGDGEVLETAADEWGRILATVPPGTRRLILGYDGGWERGLFYGLVLLLVSMAIAVVVVSRDQTFLATVKGRNEPK